MGLTDISRIKEILGRHGFRFSKSMGQNFLTASWVPERIAGSAMLGSDAAVLEIGPGIGCLTEQLSPLAAKVVCVELDRSLEPVLAETVGGLGNVEIIFGDILKQNLTELVAQRMAGLRPVVCANLPYNVTTPVLTALLECGEFEYITVMLQKEVAQRLCAGAGGPDYGAFTVFLNWHAEPELLFDVSPGCFMPQPKVTSSVVRLKARKTPPAEVFSEKQFFRIVRAAFGQRRKTLPNALATLGDYSKPEIESALSGMGLDVRVRGETLSTQQFAELTNALAK